MHSVDSQPLPEYCDVLVLGSGAAGLAAAVTAAEQGLDVLVAEKEPWLGGTSAWSGGWLWIPRNPLAIAEGVVEDAEQPETYLRHELHSERLDARMEAFLEQGPRMVEFFQRRTAVQFFSGSRMPDFHESPGFVRGGRSLCAQPFDGRQLGPWIERLRPPLDLISLAGMGIAGGVDLAHFFNARRSPRSALYVAGRLLRHFRDLLWHSRGMHLVNGNALVARLLKSALDRRVRLFTEAPARDLLRDGEAVVGARIERGGALLEVRARRGVVLACGGFPHDQRRIAQLFVHAPSGSEHLSAAPKGNTGDGLRLGESVGGQVAGDLANPAAWAPVSRVPRGDGGFSGFPHLLERAKPGFIAVRRDGRRFVNEADSYHDFMSALFAATPADEVAQAWLICDQRAQRHYGLGWSRPFPFPTRPWVRKGYLHKAASLGELARQCGIDARQLEATVAAFNLGAERGVDPQFGRGASAYNKAQGEALHGPNPSLGALLRAPFYALKLVPGSLGTFAGLRTDAEARVLGEGGAPIPGLYAVGNDMAHVMNGHYPSGGITLGPGMTFGYIAGRALAARPEREIPERAAAQPAGI
ncbi:succinate dehydrogenase/fumarate reductase flavoprotein subunit [Azotobacter vinelandii CA]|uniref:Succinate dehydrogenase/fumarate reductase flavoprotein subunit n=2 Tax=Azotobacter vinelandii TaxID=354 RepID=C1DEP4_AZOVD|nr:FAD-dependent oxidoreductase [Azotobacter vinelandii]ACO78229.1 succinate dehydrogenase/fumarate reductase flavoprotein subunit [Azotobacter vinelandii DJ]AGK15091.1 succinate dehydrogenase/fumarate reductase flavoprotein subunit [Azotobacter vinelandii CA]AGK20340.1 succinate dehydrogenase/fumarate reductase flavoprotein subunit [Azotobacter vinelandii CA6]SFX56715.1 Succinate dehydrogenase/fumarate reductase, flavoprotein subunit [Azotobacter vinelandii]GLK59882.1 FAD-binding dehydrogenas